jgi:hypothetical protein
MTTVTVKDSDVLQAKLKAKSLQNIADILTLEELQKLEKMSSSKGREALKEHWDLISSMI